MRRFMYWWRRKSIRFQLTVFVFLLVVVMSAILLAIIYQVDASERRKAAVQLTEMVSDSLEEYFVDALDGDAEDLAEHLEAFPAIDMVVVQDNNGNVKFKYIHEHVNEQEYSPVVDKATDQPQFFNGGEDMVISKPVVDDAGDVLGKVILIVDVESLSSQLENNIVYLSSFLPLFLLVSVWLAYLISRVYNAPLERITHHMESIELDGLKPIRFNGKNGSREIRLLYVGFNRLTLSLIKATKRLRQQAIEDELTGLLNRRGLQQAYDSLSNIHPDEKGVFIGVNIDHFCVINNTAGQQAGDLLLKQVASMLRLVLPTHAVIARLYGDDFRVLLIPVSDDEAEAWVRKVHDSLSKIETVAGRLSVTISWVPFQPSGWSYDLLYDSLETTHSRAREQGRGQILRYAPPEKEKVHHDQDMWILAQIRKALDGEGARFELYAQPIVPLWDKAMPHGYEVLIRMFSDEGEFITPDRFLDVAQRYNLMQEIDQWVMEQTISQISKANMEKIHKIHINVSGPSLYTPKFVEVLDSLISHYKHFPWNKIELELTETAAVSNFSQAKGFIDWCRHHGIGFALDDFGTGTASFEYLKLLPFDTVKIDGLFIRNMHKDPMDLAVIRHIREVTHLREQQVVAEFVETEKDVQALKEIGIDYGQGYYFSKPVPLSDTLKIEK